MRLIDLTGKRFGRLVVIERTDSLLSSNRTIVRWLCRCDCGNTSKVIAGNLQKGKSTSCGCYTRERASEARLIDLIGKRFERLVVIRRAGTSQDGKRVEWLCRCDCGAELEVTGNNLKSGNSKSCGCYHSDMAAERARNRATHGHWTNGSASPTYRSWRSMLDRCMHSYMNGFEYYGGRGISVCERWKEFENFLADMGERPSGTTLDRIDPDGNYTKENCRWATNMEQRHNRRDSKHEGDIHGS